MTVNSQLNSVTHDADDPPRKLPTLAGLVLICSDSPATSSVAGVGVVEGGTWRLQTIEHLCRNTSKIGEAVSTEQIDRLIVAMCQGEYSKTEVLSRSRRAGVQTFGTQIVELPASGSELSNKAVAVTAVRGAIARAEALNHINPENVKTTFSGSGEKISRRALFTIPPIEYRPVPTVDRSTCIAGSGCSQCEKACPHDAIKNQAGSVKVDIAACNSCGICVAACPQRAVEFPGYSPTEIENHVEAILTGADGSATNIAFACSKSTNLPIEDWQIVPVACAAMVPTAALLSTVASGARSVGILRCREECAQKSTDKIEGRIDYARQVLERTGNDPERIVNLAPADSGEIHVAPDFPDPSPPDTVSIDIFGRTAASSSVLGLNALASTPIQPFTHPYSPIAIPAVSSSTCTMCGTCSAVCPTGALRQVNSNGWVELTLDAAKCMACAECVTGCPEVANGAIELELRTDVTALTVGPVILNSDQSVSCDNCNAVFTSAGTLSKLESLLGEEYTYEAYGALCPECRTLN